MKVSSLIPAFFLFLLGGAVAGIPELGAVSTVGAGRIGDKVIRYVKTFNDNCLEVQIVSSDGEWRVLAASKFCSFEGKKFDSDFADAGFEDISIRGDGIHLTLSLTPLQPVGEKRWGCIIPIVFESIKKLSCSEVDK